MLQNILFRSSRSHTYTYNVHTSIHSIQFPIASNATDVWTPSQFALSLCVYSNTLCVWECVCSTSTTAAAACILSFDVCLFVNNIFPSRRLYLFIGVNWNQRNSIAHMAVGHQSRTNKRTNKKTMWNGKWRENFYSHHRHNSGRHNRK